MNRMSHVLFLVLKTCQNRNPRGSWVRDISLAARHPSYRDKKLDTALNIQTIGCYSFASSMFLFQWGWSNQSSFLSINITETLSRKHK